MERCLKRLKGELRIPRQSEFKASSSPLDTRIRVLKELGALPLELHCVIARKELVWPNLRLVPNILYNYLARTIIVPFVETHHPARLIYDRRSAKIAGPLLSFEDYLCAEVWGAGCPPGSFTIEAWDSRLHFGLCAVDFALHAVFAHYEKSDDRELQPIQPIVRNQFRIWERRRGR